MTQGYLRGFIDQLKEPGNPVIKTTKLVCMLSLVACCSSVSADVQTREAEVAKLHQLFGDAWEQDMQDFPVWASRLGDRRYNTAWRDRTEGGRLKRFERYEQHLQALRSIDKEVLPRSEIINYELFELQTEDRLAARDFRTDLMPISQRGGIQTLDGTGNRLRMETLKDFEDWLTRLSKLDDEMDAIIGQMEEGIKTGHMPPKITMQRVPAQIARQLVEGPEQSLFYKPFANMPNSIGRADQLRIQEQARTVIEDTVLPAYQRLATYFNDTYLPACSEEIGASSLPNGGAFYEYRVRSYTTTDLTPDEVHQLGLDEVARIRAEMMRLKDELEFNGNLAEFFTFLREDPQFYFEDPADLLKEYQAVSKQIDPRLVQLFTRLPRMPYGIKVIPEAVAPDTTTAYYTRPAADGSRPGYYWVKLYDPSSRPRYEIEVLSVHEAVPGHHLQIALQQELEGLPNFRRYSGFTVFTEGWGLYSERLGYDIGLYQDPYSRFGQLSYDMWRAVRLDLSGTLTIGDREIEVTGLGWLDREWSTSVLAEGLSGWDWFALQLDDQRSVMAFQLRRKDGLRDTYDHGLLVEHNQLDGTAVADSTTEGVTLLQPDDFELTAIDYFTDDTGASGYKKN